jgi:hypothetical protein
MTVLFINYRATKRFSLAFDSRTLATEVPPQYLYSFGGPDVDRLSRPLGVAVVGDRVFVTDSRRGVLDAFTLQGRRVGSWGKGKLQIPLYVAYNPKDRQLYVSDRGTRSVHKFSLDGGYTGVYDPKLPKNQLPTFDTHGVKWVPVGLAFAPDGTLYATETLNGHRLLIFGPDGTFRKSVGSVGQVAKATDNPEVLMFPNAVRVHGKEVWVADSNNRRMKVYSLDGKYLRLVATSGLPRGFDFLHRFRNEPADAPARFAVVDTLSHDVSIWDAAAGTKLLNFGSNGVLEGQFSYPNDLSVDKNNRMFIADNLNSRIQVWGWPQTLQPIPTPSTPAQWAWCLLPLLLLPLLLLFRKRTFMATPDFVRAMADADEIRTMPGGRRRWVTHEDDLALIEQMTFGEDEARVVDVVEFTGEPHSESDAHALQERLELDPELAKRMVVAKRSRVLCTEDLEMRRVARLLEVDVVNVAEFLDRFAPREGGKK